MKINIGCGRDVRKGYVNLDCHTTFGADVIFDLNDIYKGIKIPYEDNTFDEVYCSHVLEDFINPRPIMDELLRIAKNRVIIKVPCAESVDLGNIEHKYHFTIRKFRCYAQGGKDYAKDEIVRMVYWKYYRKFKPFKVSKIWDWICVTIRNLVGYKITEFTFLRFLFPIASIEIHYIKTKKEKKNERQRT